MSNLWQDVRYGFRVLLRAPGFTTLAVLILGIGIGASTTIFSAINGVLLRPLPYADPDRLVTLWESNPHQPTARAGTSAPAFIAWRDGNRTFDGLAAYRLWGFDLSGTGEPERLLGARVSANLFSLLSVSALRGRGFVASDESPAQPRVVLLSEELWRRRFGGDPRLLNTTLDLNGEPYAVVGVLPRGVALPKAELWVPLTFAPYELDQRGDRSLSVIGRLKSRADVPAARGDVEGIAYALQQRFPASTAGWGVTVTTLQDDITGTARTPLLLLFAATCAVLLVACGNLANLLLARSTARRREMALRVALGAGRSRIARQLVVESMLIVIAAGALGLLLAGVGAGLLAQLNSAVLPRGAEIRLDPMILGFVALISVTTGAGLAAIPVFDAVRLDLGWVIKAGSSAPSTRWGRVALRDVPVVGQVALALLLLVAGGLLVRSFLRAQSVQLGFTSDSILTMTASLPNFRYSDNERRAAFFEELRRRVKALPGVRSAGLVSHLPLAGAPLSSDIAIEGRPQTTAVDMPGARLVNITPGYLETLRIPLLKGRGFAESDRRGNAAVVIIDEALATRLWPTGDAVGKRLRLGTSIGADTAYREIVGIVGSVRATSPEKEPDPTIYIPHAQNPWPTMNLVIGTTGEPEQFIKAVISEVRALDANQPVYNVRSLDDVVGRTLASRRLQTLLMMGFASAAVFLAVISVYGMLAYAVAQRTRELGIRVALGARRGEIVSLCLRRALTRIGIGLVIGVAAALAATRLLGSLLFALDPWDPVTFLGAFLLLGSAGMLACYLPARRAANQDPLVALRQE
jgi:putative ABC transport system permease protein